MKLSEITEATVLEAAIEQLSKKDGYVTDQYFVRADSNAWPLYAPGPEVGATCAIGGVEQAIWRLTRQDLSEERGYASYNETAGSKRHASMLYANVMRRLNDVARRHPKLRNRDVVDEPECPIEQLTFVASKRVVLNAFKKALAGAQAEA